MALDDQGQVWVWGRGDSGQLGLDSYESLSKPIRLPNLPICKAIAAGSFFSVAITTEKSENTYGWGYGEMGQLSNGSCDSNIPMKMDLNGRTGVSVSAGGQHTVILVREDPDAFPEEGLIPTDLSDE